MEPVSEARRLLHQLGRNILRENGIISEDRNDYDWIFETNHHMGYASFYLVYSWNDSKMINEADASVYRELVDIDSKLGTEIAIQLLCCLSWTTRWDIIEVR